MKSLQEERTDKMSQNKYLEGSECIRCDVKRGDLDILEEVVEMIRVEQDFRQSLVTDALAEHRSTV